MLSLLKISLTIAIVMLASTFDYGVSSVVVLSAAIAIYMLWVSRVRPEVILYLSDLPNNLLYWICVGFPLGLVIRTAAISMILVPIYILSP